MINVADFQLKRPAGLNKILNTMDLRDDFDRDVYVDFLKRAKASGNNPKGLSIKLGYNNGVKPDFAIRTCSLCSIFFFYTKVQSTFTKVGKSASYEEVEQARVSLSFYELLLLCRDFRIIPKIITKEELYYLWKIINVQKGKAGEKVSRLVSFTDFKDFMARIAILAFNKPGIRRIILSNSAQGVMPMSTELVGMLAKYMHLDDIEWTRNRVRTVGKTTVSMINSRSAGEKNLLTRNNLREDLKGVRLAKMLSLGDQESASEVRPSTGSAGGSRSPRRTSSAPGRPKSKISQKLKMAKSQALQLEQKSTLSPFEDQVFTMFKDFEAVDSADVGGEYDTSALHEFSVASAENIPNVISRETEFEGVKQGNLSISSAQQEAMDQYHPSLSQVFDPFSDLGAYAKNKNQNFSNFDDTEVVSQNFLDMGSLVIGSKCVIRLNVVNDTPFEINVGAAVEGCLSGDPVKITTMPTSFCPGLSHSLFVSFIVNETVRNISCTVANIIVTCTSPSQPNFLLTNCCPVFFRAIRSNVPMASNSRAVLYPLCNQSLLTDLLYKFDLKNTLVEENTSMRYNPSSNSFTFPQQLDFTHASSFEQNKHPSASRVSSSAPTTSVFEVAPGAVPALVRGQSEATLSSPMLITKSPTFSTLKHQVTTSSAAE